MKQVMVKSLPQESEKRTDSFSFLFLFTRKNNQFPFPLDVHKKLAVEVAENGISLNRLASAKLSG